ncbi:MAG: squalene--hopene cyclase [Longimicrobiales bacterium]|nr:squalene--hopene cyclase [Longimicrobiales bacterium]
MTVGVERPQGLEAGISRAAEELLSQQRDDGLWCGVLEADSVLESEYIFLLHCLGRRESPRAFRAAETIRALQNEGRGWSIYPGGPDDISASVKAYFALKLLGDDPDAAHMVAARETVLRLGGVEASNTYTKIYLAVLGEYRWADCPAIPPEMMLLPPWFPFNLNEMSSWSRAIFVPLAILWGVGARMPVPDGLGIPELFVRSGRPRDPRRGTREGRWWKSFFLSVDWLIKALDDRKLRPLRERGIRAAEKWILDRQEGSDGLGAIFPGILNAILAMKALGYDDDHPALKHEMEALEFLILDDGETLRVQPTRSPIWDTAQAVSALAIVGDVPGRRQALDRAVSVLLERQVSTPGDWTYGNPGTPPGGWYFEFANEPNPDCDDTAEVLAALDGARGLVTPPLVEELDEGMERGLRWLLSMQNDDGGWAAFDRECMNEALHWVPFADHNAMLDPSCADITGRVLKLLRKVGMGPDHPAVAKGIDFLCNDQLEDGTWYGRWGCNYIYGTWLAIEGLAAHGAEPERCRRAANWLREQQNEDGGWGESLATYDDPSLKGKGVSTAAQTAWAMLALISAGDRDSATLRRGATWLLSTQLDDGTWNDEVWTGTGFPRVFYLRYGLYDLYFPLLALATWHTLLTHPDGDEHLQ